MGVAFSALSEGYSELRGYNEKDCAVEAQRCAIASQATLNALRRRLGLRELKFWISGMNKSTFYYQLQNFRAQFGTDQLYIGENENDPVPIVKIRKVFSDVGETLNALHSNIEAGVVKSNYEIGRSQRFQFLWVSISCGLSTLAIFFLAFQSEGRKWIGIAFLILSLLASIISLKATLTELGKQKVEE